MSTLLTCPRCGYQVTVRDSAPPELTCPRCLTKIENPAWINAPMPVLPLERAVRTDMSIAIGAIALLGLALVTGMAMAGFGFPVDRVFVEIMVLLVVSLLVVSFVLIASRRAPQSGGVYTTIMPAVSAVTGCIGAAVLVGLLVIGIGLLILISICSNMKI